MGFERKKKVPLRYRSYMTLQNHYDLPLSLGVGHIIFTYYVDLRVRLLLEKNTHELLGFSGQEAKLFMTYSHSHT